MNAKALAKEADRLEKEGDTMRAAYFHALAARKYRAKSSPHALIRANLQDDAATTCYRKEARA